MLLERISKPFNKLHVRLTLLFSTLFIITSAVLFTFSIFSLYSSMKAEDETITGRRLLNYWAIFQSGGIDRVIEEIKIESYLYGDRAFFVRISDKNNKTLFLKYPEVWKNFDIEGLEKLKPAVFAGTVVLKADDTPYNLEISSVQLSPEYILQIGMSTARRVSLLDLYKRNFTLLLILLIAFSVLLGIFLGNRSMNPLRDLNATLQNIVKTGSFTSRVKSRKSGDDLDEVIILFNTMLSRIENLIFEMKNTLDTVAHDLRTPMTRMRGYAELALQNPENGESQREALSLTLEESDKILTMLNTIMDISEAETGIMKLNKEPLAVKDVLSELIEIYSFIAETREIEIILSVECSNPVYADPVRFRQAVGNILDNAVKYSPDKGIISVKARNTGTFCTISIHDRGSGIDGEDLPFIWDRLYRSPSKRDTPGMGLGLSLVKAVVSAHGGTVDVSTSPSGTVFTLNFPL
ncbi:MAG: hypothetical protein DRP59_08790 [Spirochaetes bacterium]|nr:MAG: hypothetical protein DRP59_08790 [Spirochaetota bacterium]